MADELKLKITLDTGEVVDGFLQVEKKGKDSAKNIESGFNNFSDGISSKIKGIGLALAAAFTVNKIIDFFKDATKEASQAEKATNALSASLGQIGKFSTTAVDSFSEYASQLQRTTGIQDDLIKQNAALLVSLGNLSGDKLKSATKASLDLAQALQIDVGTAFDLVAKAATGNTTALSRYGLKIDENIPKSQKFAETLSQIEKRFGGLAETRLNTFEGSLQNLSNAFGEIQEAVGGFITNSPALRTVINFVAQSFFDLAKSIETFAKGGDPLKGLVLSAIQFAGILNSFVIAPIEVLFNNIVLGAKTIGLGFQGLQVILLEFANLFIKTTIEPIEFLIEKLGSLAGLVNADLGTKLQQVAADFGTFFRDPINQALLETKGNFQTTFDDISASAETAFQVPFSEKISNFLLSLNTAVEQSKSSGEQISNSFVDTSKKISISVDTIKGVLGNGLSQAFQDVGKRLQKGEGLFDDFGNSVVGIIGDLLISIGNALILQGLAIEAFVTAINSLLPGSGLLAAAAGVGLVIFGSALKASVGKGGSSAASPATGGGVSAAPSTTTELQPATNAQQSPGTSVQVVVQGNVFDSDETGMRIVDLLNQSFDKQGVVIQQGAFV